MIDYERLNKNYDIALSIVKKVIGEDVVKKQMRKVIKVGVSPRATYRHGVCKYKNNGCIIEISKHLFNVDDDEMINVLIHEILHTFKNTDGHKGMWKVYANKISKNTNYKITRTRHIDGTDRTCNYKYLVICGGCGMTIKQQRISKKRINAYSKNRCYCRLCRSHDIKVKSIIEDRLILG